MLINAKTPMPRFIFNIWSLYCGALMKNVLAKELHQWEITLNKEEVILVLCSHISRHVILMYIYSFSSESNNLMNLHF